jgi:hypothetical protein
LWPTWRTPYKLEHWMTDLRDPMRRRFQFSLRALPMKAETKGVLIGSATIFSGAIASQFVDGPTFVRACAVGIVSLIAGVVAWAVTSRLA